MSHPWTGSYTDLLGELISGVSENYNILDPYYMAQIYAEMFSGSSINPLTAEDLWSGSNWSSYVPIGGPITSEQGEAWEMDVQTGWNEYETATGYYPDIWSMGEEGYSQFDMNAWLAEYGDYIPQFNPEDLQRLQEDARFDKEAIVQDILRSNQESDTLYGNVFGYGDVGKKLQISSALATSRLKDFQNLQDITALVGQYEADLASQFEYLASTGAFNFIPEQEWISEDDCNPFTGEGC